MTNWLEQSIFYEIYPQSFRDTNGDGIYTYIYSKSWTTSRRWAATPCG